MFNALTVIFIVCSYMGLLFLGTVLFRRMPRRNVVDHPVVYALSLAVYCTSWTYYGSVGAAVSSGMLFLTIYLGPTLTIILWWRVLRKLVRIKNAQRITSIADFVSARYNKSQSVAALATIGAFIGTLPYVALQLRSVIDTFEVITGGSGATMAEWQVGPVVVALMVLFTIVFGVRHLDPTERHPGIIMLVAMESMVKLVAFLAVGVFVSFFVFDGFGDLFRQFNQSQFAVLWNAQSLKNSSYVRWTSYLVLAMSAILFLPRQFHVAVVENSRERNIRTAMWLFPLYLLLINIFVIPIALGGLLTGLPIEQADTFVLRIPLLHDKHMLALLVFIGGFSAATSMIMISSMTMATMLTNHLLLPLVGWLEGLGFLRRQLLRCRWVAVALFVLMGYWFERQVGESYILVTIGIMSFAAALQFAPAIVGGMYWRRATKAGCLLGMLGGFAVWLYTMLLPALMKSGWLSGHILAQGPWGLEWLRPEHLFGLSVLDPVSHTVFWSMLVNIGLFVVGSLWSAPSDREQDNTREFLDISPPSMARDYVCSHESNIVMAEKLGRIRRMLRNYFFTPEIERVIMHSLEETGISDKKRVNVLELSEFHGWVERSLAGSIGAAAAHRAMIEAEVFTPEETSQLSEVYGEILAHLRISPKELKERIDYYQDREKLLLKHSEELELKVRDRTMELENAVRELEEFSYSVSHDLRSPLRSINGFSLALLEDYGDLLDAQGRDYLDRVRNASHRMSELIDTLLQLARITRTEMHWETVDLSQVVSEVADEIRREQPERQVELVIQPNLLARGDKELLKVMLGNLLYNAWKFTSKKDRAKIEFNSRMEKDQRVFYVRDNGAGFDMAYAHKLFGPFKQLHSPQEYGGTGIGLSIVQRIVGRHGGNIWAEGQEGKGATFYFTLLTLQDNNDA